MSQHIPSLSYIRPSPPGRICLLDSTHMIKVTNFVISKHDCTHYSFCFTGSNLLKLQQSCYFAVTVILIFVVVICNIFVTYDCYMLKGCRANSDIIRDTRKCCKDISIFCVNNGIKCVKPGILLMLYAQNFKSMISLIHDLSDTLVTWHFKPLG